MRRDLTQPRHLMTLMESINESNSIAPINDTSNRLESTNLIQSSDVEIQVRRPQKDAQANAADGVQDDTVRDVQVDPTEQVQTVATADDQVLSLGEEQEGTNQPGELEETNPSISDPLDLVSDEIIIIHPRWALLTLQHRLEHEHSKLRFSSSLGDPKAVVPRSRVYYVGKWVCLVTLAMSLFDLQDVCIVIGSLATLDLPMVVDLIGIYVLKGPYCTLTTTNWFFQALSVIPRGSWDDVSRRFTMIRWVSPKL
ncbi:hypothetical protein F511_31271 [Dorcoceras hygrometricum]|uniref:Uncharacterized protein n=1 Tax=Dorcoceras hygrometricum TaxID=472368 RepID=A0A2Z7DEZ4_9LAMI|nr:hypothetical protein F511_31271 [Dorcoceras hygrometricum]